MNGVDGPGPGGVRDPLAALRDGRIQGNEARLQAATRLLEGTFYQELFKAMRQTVPEGGALSGGAGEEMFTGLLDQHVSDTAALRSTRGIGQALYRHFQQAPDTPDAVPAEAPIPTKLTED
jgi:flagellar protein FlgJ